jgi:hypothetical protein
MRPILRCFHCEVSIPPWVTSFPFKEHPKSEVRGLATLETLNPDRRFHVLCTDILAIHRCMGAVPADTKLTGPPAAKVHASGVTRGGDITRRSVVMNATVGTAATLSAIPVAAVFAPPQDDPIFAAIEAHTRCNSLSCTAIMVMYAHHVINRRVPSASPEA